MNPSLPGPSDYQPPVPPRRGPPLVLGRRGFLATSAFAALGPAAASLRAQTTGALMPYLQSVTPDSIWVSWLTFSGTETVIEWGTSAGALNQSKTGGNQTFASDYHYHSVQLTGLSPDTFYHYRVRTGTQTSAVHRFRTLPLRGSGARPLRVLVVGDNQILNEPRYETILARARARIEQLYGGPLEAHIDLLLNVGDQVDVGTLQHYRYVHFQKEEPVSPNLAVMTLVGNHETYSDSGMTRYKAHFYYDHLNYGPIVSPGGDLYYANHVGRVLFIHLNSEDTSATQTQWVRDLVARAATDPDVDFIVSLVHRPYQAEQYVGDISTWFRTTIAPILATPKHVLNIGAHHHLYARGIMRDWPIYHIISGGTAWDQYWGQSTETDFDDVDRTIANWAWQILEFDFATKDMRVVCRAEAHPRLGFVYPSTVIDTFHRRLGLAAPAAPTLAAVPATITLPYTLVSSPYGTSTSETLHATQFQVAKDAAFASLRVDRIRPVVNLYGDTGAPSYTPVDVHAAVDILRYQLPAQSLPNGGYFARVRHRDSNAEWSPWSPTVAFQVTGSVAGEPRLALDQRVYDPNEDIRASFEFGPGNRRDWIGIYKKGQTPGSVASTTWAYLNGTQTAPGTAINSGSILLTANIADKTEYFAAFLANDGYTEIAPRQLFYVGTTPVISSNKPNYALGEAVTIAYGNAPGGATDWIGIYRVGMTPRDDASLTWQYVTGASGTRSYGGLGKGYYFAAFMVNDEWFEIAERATFSVGTEIATVSAGTSHTFGTPIPVSFSNGPGTPKDYIGVFTAGATPGVERLVTYLYVGGTPNGAITFTDEIPAGEYFLALFINDSYSEVSNRINFTVSGGPEFPITQNFRRADSGYVLSVRIKPGTAYRIQRRARLDLGVWENFQDFVGEGLTMDFTIPPIPGEPDLFVRVIRP